MALKAKHLHILMVDDDAALVEITSRMLAKLGHTVTSRADSLNGLRLFSEQPDSFDIAILDPNMTEISGFELARRFRRIQPGLPVMLYGGDINMDARSEAEQAGVSCFEKPATTAQLETAITEAIKNNRW